MLAAGGITYPHYLLQLQLGYVILTELNSRRHMIAITSAVVLAACILAYVVWRCFEQSAHRTIKTKLSSLAARYGWSSDPHDLDWHR
ncbi:hypothetical protein [Bradyrhizobium cenepequi]|uniref:hypothetical protein n=1 Tax=Bradyrhizobium cenepequi TaxID=2821403 RepID=UPI001CE3531F|nr:hypothetical protein [Bradyrhizobium cenepequi]MCA6112236.1 hypothetical protein [Bradyrhizobium cenepequi]